ncbi:IS1182 family transposase [Clostridiaceae bacterium]|nr:IS1182 family transposase [Clostridiaceae bacterium]RKI06800.1 IS1182 family transposase [bacterium 1XD21-70]
MMGKQNGQIQMAILDIDSMIPEDHLLRQIKDHVNFGFIYEKAAPYYSNVGRKSIDPVILIKMLLIGYLYGIKSERRLEEEVSLNLAYRWFCEIDLMHRVPDHSTFSQNRKRRFKDAGIFREIFNEIVLKCVQLGIVSGETGVADGSFLPSNVSWASRYETVEAIQRSTIKYMEELETGLSSMPGYKKPENVETEKESLKSSTDPECGYIHQARKKGLGYLTEMTVDTSHGIITGVDCYPANQRESDIILTHLKGQPCEYQEIGLDGGYDIGAVHRGLELLGINGYTAIREYQNNAIKKGFRYDAEKDHFVCMQGEYLEFQKLIYKRATQNYYRLYSRSKKQCKTCPMYATCATGLGTVRINASAYYPAFYRNNRKVGTSGYLRIMRLRKIWAEGTFAVLKREHKLNKIQKRGLEKATEECLLSATALNLKRLVKAV